MSFVNERMMQMDIKALSTKISDYAFSFRKAMANGVMVNRQIESAKNVLYNNFDAIEEALKYAADAEEKIKVLELELNDAEREIDELEKKLKALEPKKTTGKKKPSGDSVGE